jgi:hypothetical protein
MDIWNWDQLAFSPEPEVPLSVNINPFLPFLSALKILRKSKSLYVYAGGTFCSVIYNHRQIPIQNEKLTRTDTLWTLSIVYKPQL